VQANYEYTMLDHPQAGSSLPAPRAADFEWNQRYHDLFVLCSERILVTLRPNVTSDHT